LSSGRLSVAAVSSYWLSVVLPGTAPSSVDKHAKRVCTAAGIAFDCEVLRSACGVSANPNGFVFARFAHAPDFDGKEL
jgi:hypothetical protein